MCITAKPFSLVCFCPMQAPLQEVLLPPHCSPYSGRYRCCIATDDVCSAVLTLEIKKCCMYCDPWQTVHAVSIPLSYWQNYLNKITMNFDQDRRKWPDSYSDLSCSSGHRYPRQGLGGGRSHKTVTVMVIGTKSLSLAIITALGLPTQRVITPHKYACSHTPIHHLITLFFFTQARNTIATSEVKFKIISKIFLNFDSNYETQKPKRCLHQLITDYCTASLHCASTTAMLTACKVEN